MTISTLPAPPRWAFWLSLVFNLILAVMVLGHLLWHHGPPPNPVQQLAGVADTLPEADGRILRQALNAEGLQPDHPAFDPGEVLDRARTALRAEPFDTAAFTEVLRKGLADRDAFEQALARALDSASAAMSAEGRHRLADMRCLPPPARP